MSAFEEKYRKRNPEGAVAASPAASATEVLQSADKEEYKPFHPTAHPEFELWVRVNAANPNAQVSIPYSYRNHMITDGCGFVISMHFSTPVICVTLQGRHLEDLFRKLLKHEVEWIQEYDPRKFDALPENAPCITGIEITRKPLVEKSADDGGTLPGEKKPGGKPAMH